MKEKVYLICPVRNCSPETHQKIDKYVQDLESVGKIVHYPPRDVDQELDGFEICSLHRTAMKKCDEIHIWWDSKSTGSHFDLGMAFMFVGFHSNVKFILANPQDVPKTLSKSFNNFIYSLVTCPEYEVT